MKYMKRNTAAILTIVLCMLFLMTSIALGEYDPLVVRVGQYVYPRSQALKALQTSIALYEAMGYQTDDETIEQLKEEVISTFVNQGVLENKLHDLGLDKLSTEDEILLNEQAQEKYEEYKAEYARAIQAQYGCDEATALHSAPVFMNLEGVTLISLRDQALAKLKQDRITQYVCKNVDQLTEEEVAAWYEENYVIPSMQRYSANLSAFEEEVVAGGGESFYVPEGYRYVQNIVFSASMEDQEQAYLLRKKLGEAQREVIQLEKALYGHHLLGEDDTQAQADLKTGQAAADGIQAQLDALYAQMAEPFAAKIEQVKNRLEAGEDFMTLRAEFDTNPEPQEKGYLVREDSIAWETSFRDAAMSLEKPGDWCGPVLTAGGAQFLLYVGDAPQGAYPMELAGAGEITQAAQASADNQLVMTYAKIWKADYEVETRPELLYIR